MQVGQGPYSLAWSPQQKCREKIWEQNTMIAVRKFQNSEKGHWRLLPSMLYEQKRVAPVALPDPATVVEELNYPFPAAMVNVAPTCVGLLYESLRTVHHWP